jgi:sirohydrochlorin cobaltochelatase
MNPALGAVTLVALLLLTVAPELRAQAVPGASAVVPARPTSRVGTVVIAHGGDSLWNEGVRRAAREARTNGPVEVAFLMGPEAARSRFQDVVARLAALGVERIVVVPLLVSSHSGHFDQVRWLSGHDVTLDETMRHHLQMSGIERPSSRIPILLTPAIDSSPEVARVLADRALALARESNASAVTRALLIVGHGPNSAEDYAAWMANLRPVADSVRAWTGFRDVRVELVRDDAPAQVRAEAVRRTRELIELQHLATGAEVLVIPILISKGSVSRDKVPADIRGTPSRYGSEPLLPHEGIARWIERRVREATP